MSATCNFIKTVNNVKKDGAFSKTTAYVDKNQGTILTLLLIYFFSRYIFFKTLPGPTGPVGSLGVPLTPGRSLAADPSIYPLGGLAFIHTKRPVWNARNQVTWKEFFRFVVLQDTGSAIRGPARADLFWGSAAETEAGAMAHQGEMYLLVKKP